MEGAITMGLGYALTEEVRFTGGEIHDSNYDTYTIPHFSWLPEIETVIIDAQDSPAQGGGEPAIIGRAVGARKGYLTEYGQAGIRASLRWRPAALLPIAALLPMRCTDRCCSSE